MPVQIQLRRDTASNWTSANPTLAAGELGLETDTAKYKIGNGSTAWNSLSYSSLPAGSATLTGTETLTNKTLTSPVITEGTSTGTILISPEERFLVSATAATGTVNVDCATQTAYLYTSNASANWTFNFRGTSGSTLSSILAVGDSISVAFAVTQGSTAYYASAHQIDGSSVTPKWQGGTAPASGNASSLDLYTYTIVKTASTPTYTLLAAQTKFA